jgi:hypothetical protein
MLLAVVMLGVCFARHLVPAQDRSDVEIGWWKMQWLMITDPGKGAAPLDRQAVRYQPPEIPPTGLLP